METCEKLKGQVCELRAQVAGQALAKPLQGQGRMLNDSGSVSSFRMRLKEIAGQLY